MWSTFFPKLFDNYDQRKTEAEHIKLHENAENAYINEKGSDQPPNLQLIDCKNDQIRKDVSEEGCKYTEDSQEEGKNY
jgi:hypothetical protein